MHPIESSVPFYPRPVVLVVVVVILLGHPSGEHWGAN
jgi:hypothetical protein